MVPASLHVDARYCGPDGRANGGYLAGLVADRYDGPMQITLRRPVPLETDLVTRTEGATTLVLHDGQLLAEAVNCELDLDVPPVPDFEEATHASHGYAGFQNHPFPRCFVCGPQRLPGDGLRIFAGPLPGRSLVAAPWVPDASITDANGVIPAYMMWAALDCPGAFAAIIGTTPVPIVLGRIAGSVDRRVTRGDRCIVVGWPIAREGRKQHVGTAIIDGVGRVCAMARATWFEIQEAVHST